MMLAALTASALLAATATAAHHLPLAFTEAQFDVLWPPGSPGAAALASLDRQRLALHAELSRIAANTTKDIVEGHSGQSPAQSRAYTRIALQTNAELIAEIGTNAGHGLASLLLGSPRARRVSVFDLVEHAYVMSCVNYLEQEFHPPAFRSEHYAANAHFRAMASFDPEGYLFSAEDRPALITVVTGSSMESVPLIAGVWATHNTSKAQLVHVDGWHYSHGPIKDLLNARAIAADDAVVVMDDIHAGCVRAVDAPHYYGCRYPTVAWDTMVAAGLIQELSRQIGESSGRGWAVGRYVNPAVPLSQEDYDRIVAAAVSRADAETLEASKIWPGL